MKLANNSNEQVVNRLSNIDKFERLEVLRGAAALMVVVHHYSNWVMGQTIPGQFSYYFQLFTKHLGGIGVELFFVISGYLIPKMLATNTLPYIAFMGKRIRRIYPLAVFAIGLAISAKLILDRPLFDESITGFLSVDLLLNFLLIPGVYPVEAIYDVTWTLSYEMLFYATCPFLLHGINWISQNPKCQIALLCILIPAVCLVSPYHSIVAFFIIGIIAFIVGTSFKHNQLVVAFTRYASLFGVPFVMFWIMFRGSGLGGVPSTDSLIIVTIVFCKAIVFGSLVCKCTDFKRSLKRPLLVEPLTFLGRISYSLYLLHSFVIAGTFAILVRVAPNLVLSDVLFFGLLTWTVIASIGFAYIGYTFIERPFSLTKK